MSVSLLHASIRSFLRMEAKKELRRLLTEADDWERLTYCFWRTSQRAAQDMVIYGFAERNLNKDAALATHWYGRFQRLAGKK